MSEVATLVGMLERRVESTPGQPAFLWDREEHSYRELWDRCLRMAAYLQAQGSEHGARIVLVLPNGPEFFYGFYGTLLAGGIAVPVFPGSGPERVVARARHCGARLIVVPSETEASQLQELEAAAAGSDVRVTSFAGSAGASSLKRPVVAPDDVAMLQYTSGSTGDPKGVQLSHGNLVTNVRQMIAGMRITPAEIFVSWLPVYHDMGLILKTMAPFYLGARLVLLPTNLTNVRSWLQAIHDHRGTFTAAPDFAYRLCLRSIRDPGAYDLKSLRVALNAAEPVRESTIVDFERAFGLSGVMVAGYGLAEATVGVAMWPPGSRPAVDSRGLVSVGPPFPEVRVRIVEDGRELGPGEIGGILIKSPANTRGYWKNEEASAGLHKGDGYLDSGDLGCLDAAGNLYIAGRKKNIIITAGRNVAPRELEEIADTFPEVRFSAALGIDKGRVEGEQAFLFAELRRPLPEEACAELALGIVERVHGQLGLRPGRVYLVRPRTIPRTYNGKLQYDLLKRRYLEGALRSEGLIVFPEY
ncbi:MAG: AMP-binding protein [Vicinamibacteria bacterium]